MDDAEFSRLLQAHMFGTLTAAERRRLIEAALETPERALEFAQVEEVQEGLSDPRVRQSLLDVLPDVERQAWWQQFLRPMFIVPLAAGAAAAVALLVVSDPSSRGSSPAPTQVAQGTNPASGGGVVVPAGDGDGATSQLEAVFALPESRGATLALSLNDGPVYPVGGTITASVTLPAAGRLFAVVRGPLGHVRQIYPEDIASDARMAAGTQTFSFAASGRLDPEAGGRSTLRVLFVDGTETMPGPQSRWGWILEHATFTEATYETAVQ